MRVKSISEFAELVKIEMEKMLGSVTVEIQNVKKNNGLELVGVSVRKTSNVAPTIYLECFYEQFQKGADIKELVAMIGAIAEKNEIGDLNIDEILDWGVVKTKLFIKLINRNKNADLLATRPHRFVADLAITYSILVEAISSSEGIASIPVTVPVMEKLGVTENDLYEASIINMNTNALTEPVFMGVSEMLASMMPAGEFMNAPVVEDEPMYVITNEAKSYGAALILHKSFMNYVAEKLKEEFYILPSSVSELLVVPCRKADVDVLKDMVETVNATEVAPDEVLSNHVYRWSRENGLEIVA